MLVMNSTFESNYMVLFNNALSKPTFAAKCYHLGKLIEESNTKVLDQIFVHLVSAVFGIGHPGWCLPSINLSQTNDFSVLRAFLGPKGPFFNMIERLQLEGACKYELPSCISDFFSTCETVDVSAMSMMASKYSQSPYNAGKQNFATAPFKNQPVQLPAFAYYFHNFAFCIMNSSQLQITTMMAAQKPEWNLNCSLSVVCEENLYYILQEDYLDYFLPTDGNYPPTMTTPNMNVQPSVVTHVATPATFMIKRSSPKPSSSGNVSYQEIWRSELLVNILVEIWMSQPMMKNNQYGSSKVSSALSEPLLRVIRRLIKHLHLFFNSYSISATQQMNANESVMDQFAHSVSVYIQPKLLDFLSYCFEKWPLDSSFRIVLETWLSYIQPWRYTNTSKSDERCEMRLSNNREVANVWYSFIITNLPFYNKLFHLSIIRFLRMDLSMQSNCYLLYRVTKIFNQSNLLFMIQEAEASPYANDTSIYNMHPKNAGSFISMTRPAGKSNGEVSRNISSKETKELVKQLITVCKQALGTIRKQLANKKKSWNQWLCNLLDITSEVDTMLLVGDGKKSEQHLVDSIRMLSILFTVDLPNLESSLQLNADPKPTIVVNNLDRSLYDADGTLNLTDAGRYDLMNNIKKVPVLPNCDPALQPICSYECAFLVRSLYKASSAINKRYQGKFERLCSRDDFLGVFSRHFLQPTYAIKGMPKIPSRNMSPRVSLRFLAHYRVLFYLFLYILFCTFSGYSFFPMSLNILVFLVLYLVAEVLYVDYYMEKKTV